MDFNAEKNQKDLELKIQSIFRQFDTDNSGSISRENIMVAMEKMGREISAEEVQEAVDQYGEQGKLSYKEFCTIFRISLDQYRESPYKS